jgi:hypothetical protein
MGGQSASKTTPKKLALHRMFQNREPQTKHESLSLLFYKYISIDSYGPITLGVGIYAFRDT